jgi:ANTAR domain
MASENGQVAEGAAEVIREGSVLRRTADGWSVGDEDLPDLTCAMVLADLIAAELPDSGAPEPGAPEPGARESGAPDAGAERPGRLATAGGAGKETGRGDRPTAGPVTMAATGPGAAAADNAAADVTAGAGAGAAAADPAGAGAARDAAAGEEGSHEEARRLRITVSQLERALAVRIRVEQAIGVLAERHRVRPRQAFEQLRSAARARGQRVIDIAGDVIASATNPLLPLPEELSRPNLAQRQRAGNRRRAREGQ